VPITIYPENANPICNLSRWYIADEKKFIEVLAWLYLRKPLHAKRVIAELAPGAAGFPGNEHQNAIRLLQVDLSDIEADLTGTDQAKKVAAEHKRTARIVHRDGLLFQHISWISAVIQFPAARARPPHVRKADKGFDGLIIELSPNHTILTRLIICEDKASENPRTLVTGSIWPEATSIFAGERDIEILDAVTAMLESVDEDLREEALASITWDRIRQFRIALTGGGGQEKLGSYRHLFAGFEDVVGGVVDDRLAGVMPMNEVRDYLNYLAGAVSARIAEMAKNV
jgi:hypothetical protein